MGQAVAFNGLETLVTNPFSYAFLDVRSLVVLKTFGKCFFKGVQFAYSAVNGWAWLFMAHLPVLEGAFLLQEVDEFNDTVDSNPQEGRFFALRVVCLLNETNWLQNVCYVVEPSDLCFQLLFFNVQFWNLSGSFLQRNNVLPSDEEPNELLAKDAERLVFFVLMTLFVIRVSLNCIIIVLLLNYWGISR